MAVKYQCMKCEKKFIDWGAEKLKFKCPECIQELVLVSSEAGRTTAAKNKPSLKRGAKGSEAAAKKKAKAKASKSKAKAKATAE